MALHLFAILQIYRYTVILTNGDLRGKEPQKEISEAATVQI